MSTVYLIKDMTHIDGWKSITRTKFLEVIRDKVTPHYFMKLPGQLAGDTTIVIECNQEQYGKWKQQRDHTAYLSSFSSKHLTMSYNAPLTNNSDGDDLVGEDVLADENSRDEEVAIQFILLEQLDSVLSTLSTTETDLLNALYFEETSAAEYARRKGISQQAISKAHRRLLDKLRKFF